MFVYLDGLISEQDLGQIRTYIDEASFLDGRATGAKEDHSIKDNEQMAPGPQNQKVNTIILQSLDANELFKRAAIPKIIRPFIVSRTSEGGGYGKHMDNVMMGPQQRRIRTDMAMTIFLNDPEDYDGGELVLCELNRERRIKLPAGSAIFYPPIMLHQVAPVTRGQRLAAITWIHSMIRHHHHRKCFTISKQHVRRSTTNWGERRNSNA